MAYLPLSTANLPDPVIDPAQGSSPEDYFNTVTYTGQGDAESVTGVGFQPDFVWFKRRNTSTSHALHDVVRGVTNRLSSNSTDAEADATGQLSSFDSDGFTFGGDTSLYNVPSSTYVAWNWKANGSATLNDQGTIDSQVSANTTSGFSIVTYTGNGNANQSVGHGLSQTPELVIFKNRSSAANWGVTGSLLGLDKRLYLNTTDFSETNTGYHPLDTATVINVSGVNNWGNSNASGANFVAYAFHSVEGFSKFGSYTGNGNADGSFIYCGFRPAFVMVKATSISGENWVMQDATRDIDNVVHHRLDAERSIAESTVVNSSHPNMDFLSNGFKHRGAGNVSNGSGVTYIYMAFAETPFRYSNAR